MTSPRDGTVLLSMPDGRAVPLRFTWRAIDTLGAEGIGSLIESAGSGQPGQMAALAEILEAASDGVLVAADLMEQADLPRLPAYVAVLEAWAAANRLPSGEDGKAAANPLTRLWTSLNGLLRRLMGRG